MVDQVGSCEEILPSLVQEIGFPEGDPPVPERPRDVHFGAGAQVIDDGDVLPALREDVHQVRADEAAPAGNHSAHESLFALPM